MTDLATLELPTFTPLIGETFKIGTDAGEIDLVLREASALGKAVRQGGAFSLLFQGPQDPALPQGLYPIRHEAIGELPLFLVPVGSLGEDKGYEAIFT
ncbi:hypothetical protein [Breoghania sp. JC706]|uniref:DUF6916 family protein n=1 Tax=Breoghania sp. JC706 TaxID=3117732 RepID=UPI003008F512